MYPPRRLVCHQCGKAVDVGAMQQVALLRQRRLELHALEQEMSLMQGVPPQESPAAPSATPSSGAS